MASNRLETIGNEFLGELTTKQWFFLAVLFTFFSEPPTLTELSAFVGSSRQNVKQLALKLQEKGFVKLQRDEQDARILRVLKTRRSIDYGEDFQEKGDRFIELLFNGFSQDELNKFAFCVDKMIERITEMQNTKNYMEN